MEALAIPQELYGQSIADSSLRLVFEKKDTKRSMLCLPRIGIPNKGVWTEKPLRFVVSGNPYISLQRKPNRERLGVGGKKMKKKDLLTYLDEIIEKQVTDYDVALDWDTKSYDRDRCSLVCRK